MQPSIPWSSSVSVFVIERTAIIHSLKCTVSFSLVVPLLPLAVTNCYLLSLVVTRCITRCHSLSLVAPLVVFHCHLLSLVVPLVVTRCHLLSLVVIRCHLLSLDAPLVCLFVNDQFSSAIFCCRKLIVIQYGRHKVIARWRCFYFFVLGISIRKTTLSVLMSANNVLLF